MKRTCLLLTFVLTVLAVAGITGYHKGYEIIKYRLFVQQVQQIRSDYCNLGLAIALVRDNHIVFSEAYTQPVITAPAESLPACFLTTTSLVRIASISKSFIGVALMQQVEAGRLKLNDDISSLLGLELRNPRYPLVPITVEMLLSHTSSINDCFSRLSDLDPALNNDYAKAYQDYAPGNGYLYCDFNLTLAACILERLTGERTDEYVSKHILKPLAIDGGFNINLLDSGNIAPLYYISLIDTAGSSDNAHLIITKADKAYRPINPQLLHSYRLGADAHLFAPASGMKISLEGLTRWMLCLMNKGAVIDRSCHEKARLLSAASVDQMMRTRMHSYHDYGLTLLHSHDYSEGIDLVGHKGGAYGLRSAFYFHPEKKYGFVVISTGALNSPLHNHALYAPDGEGDTSIRVPLLRLMYDTFCR